MRTFGVQSIEIKAPFAKAFGYISDAQNLPEWTSAFKGVTNGRALLQQPVWCRRPPLSWADFGKPALMPRWQR